MRSLYPQLLLQANSPHCPAYHQLEQGRWQPCGRGQEETKAAVRGRGGQRGPTLIFVLLQGPIRAPWNMEAAGSSPCWACSCQNVATHRSVILPIRAHFLQPVDFGTVCCGSLCAGLIYSVTDTGFLICIILGNVSEIQPDCSFRKTKPENLVSVAHCALVNYNYWQLILHLNSG